MKDIVIDLEAEKAEILKRYRALLRASKSTLQKGDKRMIRKAFDMALESHKDMRRKSGEPYIYHPIAVAQIAAEEIGLGTTSIVCALLHDVVEDTDMTLDDIEREFGKKVATIAVDQKNILPGDIRHLTASWAKTPTFGKYTATLLSLYGTGNKQITAATTFWIIPWIKIAQWAAGFIVIMILLWLARRRFKNAIKAFLDKR